MGTRHLITVVKNNEYKVAQYGQWDGYPDVQGRDILNFLTNEIDRDIFDKKVSEIEFITNEETSKRWIEIGANPNEKFLSMDLSEKFTKLYPELSRDTGAEILSIIQNSEKPIKLQDNLDFAKDSLFCEWAYVIDLDKNTFEVYKGLNYKPLQEQERFYFLQNKDMLPGENTYFPVKHVISFDLNNLPSEDAFLDTFEDEDEDEDEN